MRRRKFLKNSAIAAAMAGTAGVVKASNILQKKIISDWLKQFIMG